MPSRLALALLAVLAAAPSAWRAVASRPSPPRACRPEGRGAGERTWVGCASDPGPRRDLTARERVAFGLPLPLNASSADELAEVPGFTRRVASAVVADRRRRGPFPSVDALLRVRGVGPRGLARARPHLVAE